MTEYITQDQAVKFAIDAMKDDDDEIELTIRGGELGNAMNAAIQHYLDSGPLLSHYVQKAIWPAPAEPFEE